MLYSTGSASDVTDLLDKIRQTALAAGWTVNAFAADGNGKKLHINKGSLYFNLRSVINETAGISGGATQAAAVYINGSTSYNSGNSWNAQPGNPLNGSDYNVGAIVGLGASFTYHAFYDTSPNVIYYFVESPAGTYQWLMFGQLDKTNFGTYTGGYFYSAPNTCFSATKRGVANIIGQKPNVSFSVSDPIGGVYLTVDSQTGWAWSSNFNTPMPKTIDLFSEYKFLFNSLPNAISSSSPMLPVVAGVFRTASSANVTDPFSWIGEIPKVYMINIKNLNPAQTVTISSAQYKVFPFVSKNDTIDAYDNTKSYYLGLAVRSN